MLEGLYPITVLPEIRKIYKVYNMIPQLSSTDTGSVVARVNKGRCDPTLTRQDAEHAKGEGSGFKKNAPTATVNRNRSLTTKHLTIATYNVRTLSNTICTETGEEITNKLQRLIAGCEEQNIDIMAIQEHRLKIADSVGYSHFNNWTLAHTSSLNTHGVAVLYNKRIEKRIVSITAKSERIIAVHLTGNPRLCFVSAYAPTETAEQQVKDFFYEDLNDLVSAIPPHTITILAGDLNSRIGANSRETNPRVVGKYCYHRTSNDNGLRLISMCEFASLRPANSWFPNRPTRLRTFKSPRGEYYQLDHIIISTKWWKSLKDCRAYNTCNIGSDHKIVTAKLKLSLRKSKDTPTARCSFQTDKLKSANTRAQFDIELRNRFNALLEKDPSDQSGVNPIQRRADALNAALVSVSEDVLGKRPKAKQPSWVSSSTLQLINEEGEAKKEYLRTFSQVSKEKWKEKQTTVKAAFEKDEDEHLNLQLEALELANSKHEHRKVWQLIEKITEKPRNSAASKVRMLDGSIPKSKDELVSDWGKYFCALLNNKSDKVDLTKRPKPREIDIQGIPTCNITREEVKLAIKQLKRNKSPGPDYAMTSEVLKDGGDFIVDEVYRLCQLIYEHEQAPTQMTSSLIIALPKKGNLQLMCNFRGISLTSILAKVFNRIILNRIQDPVDKLLRNNQAGFRRGRSCAQQIHILRRVIEGAKAQDIPLYITFIDFKKAFDSVDREMMFAIMRHIGIPQKIVNVTRLLYDKSVSQVYLEGKLSEPFSVTTGVLQGDVLAPFLFIIVIDYVSRRSAGNFGYLTHKGPKSRLNPRPQRTIVTSKETKIERKLNDLAFADDIALLENEIHSAQHQLTVKQQNASEVGLEINTDKTVQIQINSHDHQKQHLTANGQNLEIVEDFKYLGSYIMCTEKDVKNRIALAWVAFAKMKKLLTAKGPRPSTRFRVRLFNATCLSVLLYGCESWTLTGALERDLDVFARKCYRAILAINQHETHMTNSDLYKKIDQDPVNFIIKKRQHQFIGHCLRMEENEPAHIYALYQSDVTDKNRRGRPTTSYREKFRQHLISGLGHRISLPNKINTPLEKDEDLKYITSIAKNKELWKDIVVPHCRGPDQ